MYLRIPKKQNLNKFIIKGKSGKTMLGQITLYIKQKNKFIISLLY